VTRAFDPAPSDKLNERVLERQILQLSIDYSIRTTPAVVLVIAAIGWDISDQILWTQFAYWSAGVIVAYLVRARILMFGSKGKLAELDETKWRRIFYSTTLIAGVLAVVGPWILFPQIRELSRQYITMLFCCWIVGAVSSIGVLPRLFLSYLAVFMGGLWLAWWHTSSTYLGEMTVLILAFSLVIGVFSMGFANRVRDGLKIRLENASLVKQLLHARDEAVNANLAKSRFLAVASHDLRQPLHSVTLLNGLLSRPQTEERLIEISKQMSGSLGLLERLFVSLLDFSKLEAEKVQTNLDWYPINRFLLDLEKEYQVQASEKGLKLNFEGKVDGSIYVDIQLLGRILRNLLDNAFKFTSVGTVFLSTSIRGQSFSIEVTDTGPGIPVEYHQDIFKEFYQGTDHKRHLGLGLGLAIVRRLSLALNVKVEVSNVKPSGAKFSISFPPNLYRTKVEIRQENRSSSNEETSLDGFEVLYIDDDESSIAAMKMLLTSWGCRVTTANNPSAAIVMSEKMSPPGLIISDYSLGKNEINGIALIECLRKTFGPVAGAIVTGDVWLQGQAEDGSIEFPILLKPAMPDDLRQLLEVVKAIG
jgi:two-component system, sensor histidine kinase